MIFKKVFRGYDPNQVDKYLAEIITKNKQVSAEQRERIDQLCDENQALREQIKQYQTDEQAISKSLIASQNLAQELKFDAEKYSDLVLSRAKMFYATWRAYSQTLISSLSAEEVEEFNKLQKRIEEVINSYEGREAPAKTATNKHNAKQTAATVSQTGVQPPDIDADDAPQPISQEELQQARQIVDVTPSETTMGIYANPIKKVEQAADQVIDLRELTKPDMSLEELCIELGLIGGK